MKVICSFRDVTERDMDMLFLEEFACSEKFLQLFTDMINVNNAEVLSVYSSKTDPVLGESDITVIVEADGAKIGLLIENKIDAPAMPEQAERYFKRGNVGKEHDDYDEFYVFIVAPEKYLWQNQEASNYPYQIKYETIFNYFAETGGLRADFKMQQITQAIEKQKKGYQVKVDPIVTEFWCKYADYQSKNFPDLFLIYNGDEKGSNATWPRFRTVIDKLHINHKTDRGYADLTFTGYGERIVDVEKLLSDTVGDYLREGFTVHKTGLSASVRLKVPKVDVHLPFEEQVDNVEKGFSAVRKLSDIAKIFSIRDITVC